MKFIIETKRAKQIKEFEIEEDVIPKIVTRSGNGAHIGIPKKYVDREVLVVILK